MRLSLLTRSPAETKEAGAELAGTLRAGDIVLLTGELGAGKTTFVQGVCSALGVKEQVTSPTFTLVRGYHGSIDVTHADLYRLNKIQEVLDLGLEEVSGVLMVEWGVAAEELFPGDRLVVRITSGDADERRFVITADGVSWKERWETLEHLLEPWTDTG